MITFHAVAKAACRWVRFCCFREVVLHGERLSRAGGYVLAPTHLSHLEPCILSTISPRPIDWMARIEFYRYHLMARALDAMNAFPVNRSGIPVRAIRTAIERVRRGRVVGIFPEGGVSRGSGSAMHGGAIKRGACLVAYHTGVPVVPVVMVGTDQLNQVSPWLPFRRARVWVIIGEPIYPKPDAPNRRAARHAMARELQSQYQRLYQELCATCGLDEQTAAGSDVIGQPDSIPSPAFLRAVPA